MLRKTSAYFAQAELDRRTARCIGSSRDLPEGSHPRSRCDVRHSTTPGIMLQCPYEMSRHPEYDEAVQAETRRCSILSGIPAPLTES